LRATRSSTTSRRTRALFGHSHFSVIKNQTLSYGPDDAIQAEFQDR
jgi:hypothetical protein